MQKETQNTPPPATDVLLPIGRSLWKIRRSLAWYGLPVDRLEALDLHRDSVVRAGVRTADGEVAVTATLDRRTGRLCLSFDGADTTN